MNLNVSLFLFLISFSFQSISSIIIILRPWLLLPLVELLLRIHFVFDSYRTVTSKVPLKFLNRIIINRFWQWLSWRNFFNWSHYNIYPKILCISTENPNWFGYVFRTFQPMLECRSNARLQNHTPQQITAASTSDHAAKRWVITPLIQVVFLERLWHISLPYICPYSVAYFCSAA